MRTSAVIIDEGRVRHIFRPAAGHFPEDTPANRQVLIDVAGRLENYVGTDRFGNDWFAAEGIGGQVWVHVRDGRITNGGLNPVPFDLMEFLDALR